MNNNEKKEVVNETRKKDISACDLNKNNIENLKWAILPNTQNSDIINIYLFQRNFEEALSDEFENYINSLKLEDMLKKLFCIKKSINSTDDTDYIYLDDIQKEIINLETKKFTDEDTYILKWLMYDLKNANGVFVNKNLKFYNPQSKKLMLYFTDKDMLKKIEKKVRKGFNFNYYSNSTKKNKYLKLEKGEQYNTMHELVLDKPIYDKTIEYIDHIQKPREYLLDVNYWTTKNIILLDESIDKIKKIKYIIYAKILTYWKEMCIIEWAKPQCNNCLSNLRILNDQYNKGIKAQIIDRSNNVAIYSKGKYMYTYFFFDTPKSIDIQKSKKDIVALAIKHKLTQKNTYEKLIDDINGLVYRNDKINIDKLFEYIKGKHILFMIENQNDICQKAILQFREFYDKNTSNTIEVDNYV